MLYDMKQINHQPVRKEVTNILQMSLGHTTTISFIYVLFSAFSYLKENNSMWCESDHKNMGFCS